MNSIRRITLLLAFACALTSSWGAVPAGYYKNINGKSNASLKTALSEIISKRVTQSSYESYYSSLPTYFTSTDVYPDSRRWWDMYSNVPRYAPSFSGLNREHCVPKSWWGGATNIPIYCDLNNMFPSDGAANQKKSNYPLGEVATATYDNGVSKLGYPTSGQGNGAPYVFEPADEYKGDFARTYFYMITCYQNTTWTNTWMMTNGNYMQLAPWAINLLLKWHRDDEVSQKEIDRNEAVYKIQNNRNPFIDYPALVEYIWGNKQGEVFNESDATLPSGDPNLITPVQDMALDFNEVAVGNTTTAKLYFKGEYLRGSLTLTLSSRNMPSDDRSNFSLSSSGINASLVNSSGGYWLTVSYSPKAVGTHQCKLIVSDGGMDGSVGILLKGQALPVPTLTAFKALPAEDVTNSSYMAVWEEANEVVDYYIVTRTRYTQGAPDVSEDLLADSCSLLIDNYDPSVRESYHVRSVRLGYESPVSNEVYVDNSGIDAVSGDIPLGTAWVPGGIRFVCGTPHTNVTIYDMQGRTVTIVDYIENNTVVTLPPGVYIVTTDECRRPVKAIVK